MQYPETATKAISISHTIKSLPPNIVSSLLAAHALSGCDTVPQMYGIGKKKALQFLKSQADLYDIGDLGKTDPNISWETIENGCIKFIRGLYGERGNKDLTDMRHTKWIEKCKSNTMSGVSDLKSFPPTLEATRLNAKRAHFQSSVRINVKMMKAKVLDAEEYGWIKDLTNKCLDPVHLEPTTPIAPDVLLKITFCGCCSAQPCSSNKCSCKKANMKCSILCKCTGTCCNSDPTEISSNDDLAVIDDFLPKKTVVTN